jgi:hypothetical protein
MALQMSNYISGRIENVVFYKRSGSFFARSMPASVKQSGATKVRSRNFGIASSAGKTLRGLLMPVIPFPKDRKMQGRFAGAIAQWLKISNIEALPATNDMAYVNHFQFNDSTGIAERFKIPIAVTNPSADLIEVKVSAFVPTVSIAAPARTASVELTITVASCKLKNGEALGNFTSKINIPYNDGLINAQSISLPLPTDSGAVVITAASLIYLFANQRKAVNIAFMPSSVIDARYL